MEAHRTRITVADDRSATLRDLPFEAGEELDVILIERPSGDGAAAEPEKPRQGGTAGDLARSPLVGLWKDRDDIGSSQEFARKLREEAQHRSFGREENK